MDRSMHDFLMSGKSTAKMPILFLGHGSPMNAIEENEFVKNFRKLSASIPKPKAILCISAHWETKGTKITAMENPTTIHDFGGFPRALFEVQYPAPGSPALAQHIHETIEHTPILLDNHWGLDHGSWSVIKHMYPDAEVPVLELSLDIRKSAYEHYELAKQLQALRTKGVLIIGSGNMVHNLGMLAWNKLEGEPYAYDWALEANEKMKNFILNDRHSELLNYKNQGKAFDLSIPTPEHYLPLLYTLGLTQSTDEPFIFNDQPVGGSLTMTSVQWG